MSRIASEAKGHRTHRAPVRPGARGRLSLRAAVGIWVLLSLLGWLAIYYGLPLVF